MVHVMAELQLAVKDNSEVSHVSEGRQSGCQK